MEYLRAWDDQLVAALPMWTVIYAANADQVHNPRVVFRPFADGGMSLPIALALRAGTDAPG